MPAPIFRDAALFRTTIKEKGNADVGLTFTVYRIQC